MEAHIEALKTELGEGLDYSVLEGILEGDFDEEEWDRVVGQIMEQAAEQVSLVLSCLRDIDVF